MVTQSPWLRNSRQRWKIRTPPVLGTAGAASLLLFLVLTWPPGLFIALLLGSSSIALPLLIRCSVCGVRICTSPTGLEVGAHGRRQWLDTLASCPVCGDDGRASFDSRARWAAAGAPEVRPYWSTSRILLAILATALLVGGGVLVGALSSLRAS